MDEPRLTRSRTRSTPNQLSEPSTSSSNASSNGVRSTRQPKRRAPPVTPERRQNPRPKRKRSEKETSRQNETTHQPVNMNESIDYVALVEQHLQDEAYARRLQAEEHSEVTVGPSHPAPVLPRPVPNLYPLIDLTAEEAANDTLDSPLSTSNSSLLSTSSADSMIIGGNQFGHMPRMPPNPMVHRVGDNAMDLFDSSDEEGLEEPDIPTPPQRRNAVLVTGRPHQHHHPFMPGLPRQIPTMGRVSGSRESLHSLTSAIDAMRHIREHGGTNRPFHMPDFAAFNDSANFGRLMEQVMHRSAANISSPVTAGLSKTQLNQLPISDVSGGQLDKTCTVCMENYELGGQVRTLPCFHFFHPECVDPWLNRNRECPVCRVSAKPQ